MERHISGVYTKMLMDLLVDTMSPGTIQDLLRRAGETRTLTELSDIGSWSSYTQFRNLLEQRRLLDGRCLVRPSRGSGQAPA